MSDRRPAPSDANIETGKVHMIHDLNPTAGEERA
jgi:hypothetical protein